MGNDKPQFGEVMVWLIFVDEVHVSFTRLQDRASKQPEQCNRRLCLEVPRLRNVTELDCRGIIRACFPGGVKNFAGR